MAYRRPGIEVVQQFQALSPALVLPTLPAVIVGPAFQIEEDGSTGETYVGASKIYSYPNLYGGAVVDTNSLDADEIAATQKPVSLKLITAYIKKAFGSDGTTVTGDQTFATVAASFASITPSSTVQYFVELNNSNSDDGKHLINSKTSSTSVELADELQNSLAGTAVYKVLLKSSSIEYDNDTFTDMGITISTTAVTIPSNLPSDPTDPASSPVSEAADVEISYRALRPDLADSLDVYTDLDSLEAVFGIGLAANPANPYGFGVNIALGNTTTEINATGLRAGYYSDEALAYQTALEFLESKDVYGICVLTQSAAVAQTLSTHVSGQSVSTVGRERIGFVNRELESIEVIVPTSGIGTVTSAGTGNGTSAAHVNTTFKDPTNGEYILDGVSVGNYLEISAYVANEGVVVAATTPAGGDSIVATTRTIVAVTWPSLGGFSSSHIGWIARISGATTPANNGDWEIESVTSATTAVVKDPLAALVNESGPTFAVTIIQLAPTTAQDLYIRTTRHYISNVVSNTRLTLQTDATNGFYGTIDDVEYRITENMTRGEEASFLAGWASSFANRRLVSVWPDTCAVTVGGIATLLPGFYFGCALVGLVAGLPSQQGFTNLSLTGFVGRENSDDRFTDAQLDTIAGGGNLILTQEVDQAPVFVRHQLTTDTSSIQFQELSVTKNVDLIARFFRSLYSPYIGKYNITDALKDLLKTITVSGIDFLKNQKAPRVGGVLRDGSMSKLVESISQPDSIEIEIDVKIPYPLNNIKVTLLV
jgi:hypothetical protein